MNPEECNLALKNAVLDWQKKNGIRDGDPILATLELWEIYLNSLHGGSFKDRIATFDEFRGSLEQLDRACRELRKYAGEIIVEIRAVPRIRSDLIAFPYFALIFTAVVALLAGGLIGKFLL